MTTNAVPTISVSNSVECEQSYVTALKYCDDILAGNIVSSAWVKLACQRFRRELERSDNDPNYRWVFNRKKANRAITFFSMCLKLHEDKWAGKPFALSPWQQFFVANSFGWVSRENPKEWRWRAVILDVGRKNGKTTLVAGMMILAFILSDKGCQAYTVATKEDQARILHTIVKRMVLQSDPDIRELFKVQRINIEIPNEWKKMMPLGRDSQTLDGLKPDVVSFDECAAIVDPNVFNVILTGQLASSNVMNFLLTTAQDYRGPFYEIFREPLQSALLEQDDSADRIFGMVYSLDAEDISHWDSPHIWIKSNPNIGVSVRLDAIAEESQGCKSSILRKNAFLVKNLNYYMGSTQGWLDVNKWEASAVEEVPISEDCFLTFDLSRSNDLTAMCMWFRFPDKTRSVILKCFIPQKTFDDLPPMLKHRYGQGINEGTLELVPGELIDPDIIERQIREWHKMYRPSHIGYDRWCATLLTAKLAKDVMLNLLPISQSGTTINPAAMDFETLLSDGRILHSGSSFINWQINNACIRPDTKGNLYPQKSDGNSPNKIDAVIAMVMASHLDTLKPINQKMYWGVA